MMNERYPSRGVVDPASAFDAGAWRKHFDATSAPVLMPCDPVPGTVFT
jgi:hypothetical protein